MDRRIADDAVVGPAAAGLELRLDERDDVAARAGPERADDRAEDLSSEMNDTSMVDEVDRFGQGRRRSASRAFVRSIETTRGSARSDSASWPRPTSRA